MCVCVQVAAAFTANVWDIKVAPGDDVSKDQTLMVLEAMKMESPVVAPVAGKVKALRVAQGAMTHAGQLLLVIEEAK
jgi:urea carboxylase